MKPSVTDCLLSRTWYFNGVRKCLHHKCVTNFCLPNANSFMDFSKSTCLSKESRIWPGRYRSHWETGKVLSITMENHCRNLTPSPRFFSCWIFLFLCIFNYLFKVETHIRIVHSSMARVFTWDLNIGFLPLFSSGKSGYWTNVPHTLGEFCNNRAKG